MNAHALAHLQERVSFDCPASLLARLANRYAEPHRRYHTATHIVACFEARHRISRAAMPDVDLALLFHDAVYSPLAGDNEARSAELLVEEGRRAWLDDRVLQRAEALVRATQHGDASALDSEEACIVVDADLSILGSDELTFDLYERQVREEFEAIDDASYAAGRSHVLSLFLAREAIYATRPAQRLWEARARKNLERSMEKLGRATLSSR
jgi:predicted metal-dependent HD superfamily phosphohydrolase